MKQEDTRTPVTSESTDNHETTLHPGFLRRAGEFFRHYAGGLYHRVDEHHIFLLASGLAFSLFICIIPMVLVVFAVLGTILEKPSIAQEIDYFIKTVIPYADYAAYIKDLVFLRVEEFTFYKNVVGLLGAVGLFVAASSLFSSMRTILDLVYRVEAAKSVLIGKLWDLVLVILVLLYFLLSTTVLPGWHITKRFAHSVDFLGALQFGFVEDLLLGTASFVFIFLSFFLVYSLVQLRNLPRKALLISALSAAVLWKLAEQLFGFYITHFVTLKRVYGAYTLLVVVAFWIYYTSLVFILGAEIGQLYRERKQKKAPPTYAI